MKVYSWCFAHLSVTVMLCIACIVLSLLNTEEVFDFKLSVFGKVGAMHSIHRPRVSELCSQRIGPEVLGDLWVHWANELPEGLHGVLLSDLHDDARTNGHGLYHANELWEDTLVDLEEFLGRWLVKCEHLHRGDLEALLEDGVDHLTSQAVLYHMWLDDATGAIVECCCGREVRREEEAELPLVVGGGGGGMDCVPHHIGSEGSAQTSRRLLLGHCGVSWTQDAPEGLDGVGGHQFHASDDVTLHVGRQVSEEGGTLVLLVEGVGQSGLCEFAHLELGDCETVFVHGINDLASLNVTVWFNQRESPSGLSLELVSCEEITVVDEFQLSGVDIDDGAEEELTD